MSGEYAAYQSVDRLEQIFEEFPRLYVRLEPHHIDTWDYTCDRAMPLRGHLGWQYSGAYAKAGRTVNNDFNEMQEVPLAILKGVLRSESSNLLSWSIADVTWHDLYPRGAGQKTILNTRGLSGGKAKRFEEVGEYEWDNMLNPPPNFSLQGISDIKPTTLEFIDPRVAKLFGTHDVHEEPFITHYREVLKARFETLKRKLALLRMDHSSNNNQIYGKLYLDFERSVGIDIAKALAFLEEFKRAALMPYKKHWLDTHRVDVDTLANQLRSMNHKSKLENKKMLFLRLAPMLNEIHRYYAVDMIHGYMRTLRYSPDFLDSLDTVSGMNELDFDHYVTGLRDTTQAQLKRAIKALVRAFVTMEQIYGEAGFPIPEVSLTQRLKEMKVTPFEEVLSLKATPATPQLTITMGATSETFVPHNP